MKIKNCRSCSSQSFKKLYTLGNQYLTGIFPKNKSQNVSKGELSMVMCNKCFLLQLENSFDVNTMYGENYGYLSSLNPHMIKHLKIKSEKLKKISKLSSSDIVMDIGSNDGTFLSNYKRTNRLIGVDPTIKKLKKFYRKDIIKIADFFSADKVFHHIKTKKPKIITSISMFYDLPSPIKFAQDIYECLDDNGIWHLEQSYMPSMLKNISYDTICHEHLEYYSSNIIINLMKKNNLRVFDIKNNDINGGSSRYFICHKNGKFKINKNKITKILRQEEKLKLEDKNSYFKYYKKINLIKNKTKKLIENLLSKGKVIHGYGASTKGNVFLQYLEISSKKIPFIAERNPLKFNKFTPGNYIKIISEKKSRLKKPDYYLVLPWHFKKEILKREMKIRRQGTKFIFPLPNLKVI